MLTKNVTPYLFAARVTSRRPPQREMVCVVRAAFAIDPAGGLRPLEHPEQGMLSADELAPEDDEQVGASLRPSDFADFKLSAEVLLKGSCHPGGRAVTECTARFAVGAWSKSLRVVGPRVWGGVTGGSLGEPATFTSMPLTWQNAFGGPGFEKNPVGKGVSSAEGPTVEIPGAPVRSRSGSYVPATFGPVNPNWPERASLVGQEYGSDWRKRRAPFYADDFDWRHFFSAPADQRLQGYLQGDERVTLENLHPAAREVSFSLPNVRVRVFAKGTDGRFREVGMSLDTLYVDTDDGKVYLTWRGLDAVAEDDLSDVATLLIASETLGAAQPSETYRAQLDAFEKDPLGLEGQLPSPAMLQGTPTAEDTDPVSRLLAERGVPEDVRAELRPKLAAALAEAKKQDKDIDLEAILAAANDEQPPAFVPIKPGVMPPQRLRVAMRKLVETIADARRELIKQRGEIDKLPPGSALPSELSALRDQVSVEARELEEAEKVPRNPQLKQLDPSYSYPEPLSTDEPGPGANLLDRDLKGRDLRGADLRGANLEAADLSKADLSGALLQGANLKYAILWKANLEGADLTGADLTLVNAIGAQARRAVFKGARLETSSFEGAVLDEAVLEDAIGHYVVFTKASLLRASLSRADLSLRARRGPARRGEPLERGARAGPVREGRSPRSRPVARAALGLELRRSDLRRRDLPGGAARRRAVREGVATRRPAGGRRADGREPRRSHRAWGVVHSFARAHRAVLPGGARRRRLHRGRSHGRGSVQDEPAQGMLSQGQPVRGQAARRGWHPDRLRRRQPEARRPLGALKR
ncbi:MAG: DUF2169 domain-containing protein [Polyangiaceae bacterium]|nr:DUF2169 domain-containing protein [Polyangiaceae bacterium]